MNISIRSAELVLEHARHVEPQQTRVSRRKVFYLSGYDALGPRRYRELYRREGPKQARISGYDLTMSGLPRSGNGNFRWKAVYQAGPCRTTTEYEFLGWDDIVRGAYRHTLWQIYPLMFRTLWIYLSSGAIGAMLRLRCGPLIAGLVPALLMMFYLVYASLIGVAAGLLIVNGLGASQWLGASCAVCCFTLSMLATRLLEDQLLIYFMVNDLAYSAQDAGAYPAPLSDRLDVFADQIDKALHSGDFDEVLVVGHSSGAQLAVTALARCIDRLDVPAGTSLGLVTLGQSIAMTSFLPKAHELRRDLARIADDERVFWLDVTAPGDGACFALTDPAANCRQCGRTEGTSNPLVVSAAFRKSMDPAQRRRNRWRLLRMHFQYLCAFSDPSAFDYFATTAGPQFLRDRYAGRGCSPSMDARPVAPVLHQG